MRIPCVRCLLREMDEQTALQQVLDFQRSVPKMKHALRYARRVNGLIKVLAENVVLMWKREPFGQMHIARWGQTCGDCQTRSLYHISISLFIKLANPLFQSLFACFTSLFAR